MTYRFHMRVVDMDPTGYYYVRWDKATPVVVEAANRDAAFKKLWELMGKAPLHSTWTAQIDKIEAAPACSCSEEARCQAKEER